MVQTSHLFTYYEQLDTLNDHGTRIVIYNLWETDSGEPELDLESDPHVWMASVFLFVE